MLSDWIFNSLEPAVSLKRKVKELDLHLMQTTLILLLSDEMQWYTQVEDLTT